jgi:bifunctional DNA-binding transcriptional regulator/antitoxin component of YhaV-PrlF toxin-antitoxin module
MPVDVCRKLGVGPGSVLKWEEDGDKIVVRRACLFTSEEIHRQLFGANKPKKRSVEQLKEGMRRYVRKRFCGAIDTNVLAEVA